MASGCVIEYRGKRGRVFRIKYTDAIGRQVMETLGRGEEGWTTTQLEKEYAPGKTYEPATVNLDVSVLHDVLDTARREELIETNPADRAERPKVRRRRWRILKPVEIATVLRGFSDLAAAASRLELDWIDQARVAFLTLVLTGVRRFELQRLRWRDVDLVENVLRVADSKTEDGVRSIALPPTLAEELWEYRRRSRFPGRRRARLPSPGPGNGLTCRAV